MPQNSALSWYRSFVDQCTCDSKDGTTKTRIDSNLELMRVPRRMLERTSMAVLLRRGDRQRRLDSLQLRWQLFRAQLEALLLRARDVGHGE